MDLRRFVPAVAMCVAVMAHAPPSAAEPTWTVSPPVVKGEEAKAPSYAESANAAKPAPLRKEEARAVEEFRRLPIDRIFVEGIAESDGRKEAPRTKEQKFAAALNAGNPEVAGGKIRHGMFYDDGVYWAPEPLSFIYYNIVNRFKD
jgi:hypothetical protein